MSADIGTVPYGTILESRPHPNPPHPGMVILVVQGEGCERCGHQWVPRLRHRKPRCCPECKSPYWDKPRQIPVSEGHPAARWRAPALEFGVPEETQK